MHYAHKKLIYHNLLMSVKVLKSVACVQNILGTFFFFLLWCVASFTFWGEISTFSYHLDLVWKILIFLDLVRKIVAVGHMFVWNEWQHHLPMVMSCDCLDISYPLWHHNGHLLWHHSIIATWHIYEWGSHLDYFTWCDETNYFYYNEIVHNISIKNKQF